MTNRGEEFKAISFISKEREYVIEPAVFDVFERYRQTRWYSREAGGQLFAKIHPRRWNIVAATGPRRGDIRRFYSFTPNRRAEQLEINSHFERGLQFVGDWHTHPEDVPTPSQSDIDSIKNVVRESQTAMPGFLLCIVGRAKPPEGIWLSFERRDGLTQRLKVTSF